MPLFFRDLTFSDDKTCVLSGHRYNLSQIQQLFHVEQLRFFRPILDVSERQKIPQLKSGDFLQMTERTNLY